MNTNISTNLALMVVVVFAFAVVVLVQMASVIKTPKEISLPERQIEELEQAENRLPDIAGNDRDEYGCIPSAGYTWCEEKDKCLRTWEEECEE
jgi:hypothetical protein